MNHHKSPSDSRMTHDQMKIMVQKSTKASTPLNSNQLLCVCREGGGRIVLLCRKFFNLFLTVVACDIEITLVKLPKPAELYVGLIPAVYLERDQTRKMKEEKRVEN